MSTQDALARAIDYLNAVEVAPGRYARRECASVPYEIVPLEQLLREGFTPEGIARFGHRDRQFCGIISMPEWWSPEQRFAAYGGEPTRVLGTFRTAITAYKTGGRIVTASVVDGREVPA